MSTLDPLPTAQPRPPLMVRRPIMRWLVPAAAALAVLGGGAAIGAVTAATDPALPTRSAAQLLVDVQTAHVDGLTGTVVQRSDLGLPALPGGGAGSADLTSLISGTHTLRVWYASPNKARVALLGTLGESDVITNGTDLWTWSSQQNKATHRKLPAMPRAGASGGATPMPSLSALNPQQLADAILKVLGRTAEVTTNGTVSVAGRDAYELVVSPRDSASLVGSVRLAVDAAEHVPLRVQIVARGAASPAIEVAFTQISFTRPADDQFTFNPPPGATVVEGDAAGHPGPGTATPGGAKQTDRPRVATVGSGWTTVFVSALPTTDETNPSGPGGSGGATAQLQTFLKQLPAVSGAWGSGHLLRSSLLSVLVTDDGRILIGAVAPERLYAAAADPAGKLTR